MKYVWIGILAFSSPLLRVRRFPEYSCEGLAYMRSLTGIGGLS
jgi:hypothetical protein